MKKTKLIFIIFNSLIIIFIISFFTFIFVKNFSQIKNIFEQPITQDDKENNDLIIIEELERNLENYLNLKNSANK
ncbi:MAG: hypothetical protein KatS3mg095_0236 [Candidatus Parcubacteria bacterium]|nr:MAG: hypothetical protein KatS3mg095_0236 [Candidatus Parcubacteria bacterium]